MVAEHKKPNLEVPEEALVEQLTSDDVEEDESLAPLDSRTTSVSEADWADQQAAVPLDDDEREDER